MDPEVAGRCTPGGWTVVGYPGWVGTPPVPLQACPAAVHLGYTGRPAYPTAAPLACVQPCHAQPT